MSHGLQSRDLQTPVAADVPERSGIRSSFWDFTSLATSNLLLIPLTLAVSILATRILGKDGLGRLSLFGMVAGLFLLFTSNWNLAAVLRFGREEFDRSGGLSRTFWARNVLLLPGLAIGAAVAYVARHEIAAYLGLPDWIVWPLIASFVASSASSYVEYLLQSAHRLKAYAAIQVLRALSYLCGLALIAAGLFDRSCPNVVIAGLVATLVASGSLGVVLLRPRLFRPIGLDRPMLREVFRFSYPVVLGSTAAFLADWVDVVVIKHYSGYASAGGYSLALTLYGMCVLWTGSIVVLMTPMLISFLTLGREDLIKRYVNRLAPQGMLLLATAAGVMMGLLPLLFGAIYGAEFAVSGFYFQILAFGLALSAPLQFNGAVLTAYKVVKLNMVVCVARALVNLAADLWLVPGLGPAGAALANAAGTAFAAIGYLLICQWLLKTRVLWQVTLAAPALLSLIVCLAAPRFWGLVLAPIVALAAGYALVNVLGLFRPDDGDFLNAIRMPERLRRIIMRVYVFLSPGKQS